jgi:dihydrofolate reductase (trimethoprim resistance protein)
MTKEAGPAVKRDEGLRQVWPDTHRTFGMGDNVRKVRGSQWHGRVVGWYSTELTPEGYAVESDRERGSVQIYPASALERAA